MEIPSPQDELRAAYRLIEMLLAADGLPNRYRREARAWLIRNREFSVILKTES
jgi:hypothetical protein